MSKLKYPIDKYPNSDVFERYMILKLLLDKNVQDTYLPKLLPQIFMDNKKRLVSFVMKRMHEREESISPETVVSSIKISSDDINLFKKRHYVPDLKDDDIYDMATDTTVDSNRDYVNIIFGQLTKYAFARFVANMNFDIDEANEKFNESMVLAKARGIVKVHDVLYDKVKSEREDQLKSTMELINSDEEYVKTMSQSLNSYMGGFTRGYVATVGAKSGHTKSSWTDANILQNILTNKVKKVLIISPEEMAQLRWRRIFAMICKIPTSKMRQKESQITEQHVKMVRERVWDRLVIEDKVHKMEDVIKLMEQTDADMIYVDHLQSITYPGSGTAMNNMIGNIPGLVNIQKKIAKEKNVPVINLSQVNDKDIQRSDRLVKAPRYWDLYGSSVLYQAARELIMLWYQYKDYDDMPGLYDSRNPPSINKIYVILEKSSFSRTAKIPMYFDPDYNYFRDDNPEALKKLSSKAPAEQDINQLSLI